MRSVHRLMNRTEERRKELLGKLSLFVRKSIIQLQNPEDCDSAKLLVCNIAKNCGFGCYTHYMTNCLLQAIDHQRTMVLAAKEFRYAKGGWEYTFEPLSSCKRYNKSIDTLPQVSKATDDDRVAYLSAGKISYNVQHTIPYKMADLLFKNHGDPYAWWIGQAVSYLLRPNPWLQSMMSIKEKELNFKSPIVGIQVRRGDKLGYSKYFSVEDYMFYAERWFEQYEIDHNKTVKRTFFVASEDMSVLPELKEKYPDYNFLTYTVQTEKLNHKKRFTESGLEGIVMDVHFLSHCDYVVCTLSSNVCDLVYELMMNIRTDPSTRLQSLDMSYRFKVSGHSPWKAVFFHRARNKQEIDMIRGDRLSVRNDPFFNYASGFTNATNLRTNKMGIFPTFKGRPIIELHKYSIY